MTKFRRRLTVQFMLLVVLSLLAAGLLTADSYRRTHQTELKDHMIRELQLINATSPWPDTSDPAALKEQLQAEALRYKKIAGMRVTFIAADGTVLGDSDHEPGTMDNHLSRTEVREALASGIGSSLRHSDTLEQNMLYVATTVKMDGKAVGFVRLAMSLKMVDSSLYNMWLVLGFGLIVLFILATAVSYRLARLITRPLERMTTAAKRMANMDYAIRVPEDGRDEISELARALNLMAKNLQEQMDQIRQNGARLQNVVDNMTSGVVMIGHDGVVTLYNREAEKLLGGAAKERLGRPFTEIRQHIELVELIREALEFRIPHQQELPVYYPEERQLQLNLVPMPASGEEDPGVLLVMQDVTAIRRLEKMRSEFVANVSHELKTPIAAVKGFTETLLSGAMNDPGTARSFLTIIHDESERLNRLIGDILELSKIESRRAPLQYSPVDLGVFLSRMKELFAPEAAKKNIALELDAADGLFLEADEDRLGQILLNLLQNGINYTPEGGRVKVQAEMIELPAWEEGDERVRITVSDTGIGIPKKDIPRIFERFYRVDKDRSRDSGGTGLGLSIVKHLVELHNGTIRVESTVGVGTKFILELPVIHP
ncbi:cell wall metabolism sensor histidine kinase WalK [Cohnella pontilimi]|uniref:histidine kinase n=1 Tax=Cohnella pontilimi TaxID=2564100 RepID=A0A4U0F535_9BACL|nr:ATP-binding protein [Cohnella pontilimi]TJY39715.1 cell wall metabolism sensor histidine kinase WalK [Cohnella pontilimi]